MKKLAMAMMAMALLLSCTEKKEEATLSGLKKADFVLEVEGKPTALYVLTNKNGAEACITNYGGRLVSLMVPDKNGKMTDVVLGYDNIAQYVNTDGIYGALIGRYGNRIRERKIHIERTEYTLPPTITDIACMGPRDITPV
jgi:aldose 1-epimerase